jgi:hypothetical protein
VKKAALIVLLVAVIGASFTIAVQKIQSVREMTARLPNIMILSFCSLRRNLLTTYGGEDPELMPNIEKFFKESTFAFSNVLNGLSWTAIFGYTRLEIEKEFFGKMGYRLLGASERNQLLRVPIKKTWNPVFKGEVVDNSDFEKDIRPTLEYLERSIKAAKDTPFFLIAHVKYLHFPLIDRFNSDSGWDYFLNDQDKAKVNEYLGHPDKYWRKLPFLLLLANNPHHALMHPKVKANHMPKNEKELYSLGGLMTNPEYLEEWKASEGYADDLRLLEKIYRGNARFVDKLVAPILNLYGDKDLQKNTILFFTGDHGEMHMERDELTHGLSLWDQALLVPFAVKFPGFHWPRMIREQIGFQTMARAIRDLLTRKNTPGDFRESLKKYRDDLVLGRDCNNQVRGLRFKNKYKYFVTAGDSERYLFDLENDPKELNNLAKDEPGLVSQMESLYWQNYARFAASSDPFTCAPWVL